MRLEQPQIYLSPRRARFVGHRRLPQFVRVRGGLLDVHVFGLWWLTIAWLAPARRERLV